MDVMVERCPGLDVHHEDAVATMRAPGVGRRQGDRETHMLRASWLGSRRSAVGWRGTG